MSVDAHFISKGFYVALDRLIANKPEATPPKNVDGPSPLPKASQRRMGVDELSSSRSLLALANLQYNWLLARCARVAMHDLLNERGIEPFRA